jgi:hypothetical protein
VTAEPLVGDWLIAKLWAHTVDHHAPAALLAGYDQFERAGVQFGKGGPVGHAETVTNRLTMRRLSAEQDRHAETVKATQTLK